LGSRTFARSSQLRAFLRFVCEAEIRGEGGELTEHLIGVAVLQRPKDYLPSEDSSVRTRAHELRHKLARLYEEELRDAPLHIVIPKGAYSPTYVRAAADIATVPTPVRRFPMPLAWVGLGLVLGVASALILPALRPAAKAVDPIVAEAWRAMARPEINVLLCAATPLHLVMGPESHEAYGSPTYPAPPEAYALFRQHRPLAPDAKLGMIFTDNVLGVGTMNAVVIATNTLRSFGSSCRHCPGPARTQCHALRRAGG
jgi:hypothetical protein